MLAQSRGEMDSGTEAWTLKEVLSGTAAFVLVSLATIIAWLTRRDLSRYDDGLERIAELERTCVTRSELEQIIANFRLERSSMHNENKALLDKIDGKLDNYELRRSKTEHNIRNIVASVNLKVAVLASTQGIKLPHDPDTEGET